MSVRVYTKPSCVYCNMVKKYLESKNVRYDEIDVSMDIDATDEMVEKSGQRGVPVIDFDGSVIIGFDKNKIDRML